MYLLCAVVDFAAVAVVVAVVVVVVVGGGGGGNGCVAIVCLFYFFLYRCQSYARHTRNGILSEIRNLQYWFM